MRQFTGKRGAIAAAAACLMVVMTLSGCAQAPTVSIDLPEQAAGAFPDDTTQQMQDAVSHAMAAAGASGAIVGVWAPWSGSWVAGVGTQSFADDTPVSVDDRFHVADVTRAMTCDILYDLDAQKKLDADASVTDYVGGVAQLEDITLRQLCDSTSGLGTYEGQLLSSWLRTPDRAWNPRELAAYGIGKRNGQTPGTAYRSSDAGYLLLGLALERASGMTAQELVDEYIAEPLALEKTALPAAASSGLEGDDVLTGLFTKKVKGKRQCTEPTEVTGTSSSVGFTDSGVVSDVADLGRYAQALATDALLPKGSDRYAQIYPASSKAQSWDQRSGGTVRMGSMVGQYGAVPGYATSAFSDPASGLTVVVALNNSAAGGKMAAYLSWELAALASKAPAASGETAPDAGLPWTAEQQHDKLADAAICSTE
ncbi:serine hydrolase domain-containing protein [Microbacterium fluvii]|uniref:Serine hydrolase domain-containing protein n=1 Tax=Microbacterium fluvii TaxID=415215 RepID=A0ABW2HCT4_9MICO|nr:serine hydrolase domain-containing protein [Microbacterium fluvii]MCU4672702.1 beta-lactamase family protein [Microbacterium fluvii]